MFTSTKSFRRGTGLGEAEAQDHLAALTEQARAASRWGTALVDGSEPKQHPAQKPWPTGSHPWVVGVTNPSSHDRDAAGATPPPQAAPALLEPTDGLRVYPSVPYYGLLHSLTLHVDVAMPNAAAVAPDGRVMNPSETERCIPAMERLLNKAAAQHGSAYVLSNCGCDHHPQEPRAGRRQQPTGDSAAAPVTYGAYLGALTAIFREFHRLRRTERRARDPSAIQGEAGQHHTLHVRISGHPRWRDVSALLSLEGNRMVLFLSASSKTTQRHVQQRTAELTQPTTWVAGATLANEPSTLSHVELNPFLAAWNAFLGLPLLTSVEGSEAADDAAATAQARRSSDAVLSAASQALQGFRLSVVSSLPFPGATRHVPVVRLQEVAPILAPLPAAQQQTTEEAPGASQVLVGRQFTWRVSVPCLQRAARDGAVAATPLLVPSLLSHLVAALVDGCGLGSFVLSPCHGNGAAEVAPSAGVASEGPGAAASTGGGVKGLAFVGVGGGASASGVSTQRGPSSQSWLAFSRLSSMAWLTDAQRRAAGLVVMEEDGEESPLECEFALQAVRYQRPPDVPRGLPPSPQKRTRSDGAPPPSSPAPPRNHHRLRERKAIAEASAAAMTSALTDLDDCVVCPERWGRGFRLQIAVQRAMEAPSDEDEDGERGP